MIITITFLYRNKNYHEVTDTMETSDLNRMGKVIDEFYLALLKMNEKKKL
jgi:hypothetical protein